MAALDELGVHVAMLARPVEIVEAVPFADDTRHCSYDPAAIHRFWLALVQIHRVFTLFRSRYVGKASPVHFFCGGFDLAVSRFSGRPAPRHPGGAPNCADWVMQLAYSHEVSSCGFWLGDGLEGSFYAYAYPEPAGFAGWNVRPAAAFYDTKLSGLCRTTRCEPRTIPTSRFWSSCIPPMKPPPSSVGGTAALEIGVPDERRRRTGAPR